MEHRHTHHDAFCEDHLIAASKACHYIPFPYTEAAIITLHALCITPGIHHIEIESLEKGRTLLEAVLASLNYYTTIVCITTSEIAFTTGIYDCSHELAMQPCIERFFIEQFSFDCMVIEQSPSLTQADWYIHVEKYLYTSTISLHAPIIFVGYIKNR